MITSEQELKQFIHRQEDRCFEYYVNKLVLTLYDLVRTPKISSVNSVQITRPKGSFQSQV